MAGTQPREASQKCFTSEGSCCLGKAEERRLLGNGLWPPEGDFSKRQNSPREACAALRRGELPPRPASGHRRESPQGGRLARTPPNCPHGFGSYPKNTGAQPRPGPSGKSTNEVSQRKNKRWKPPGGSRVQKALPRPGRSTRTARWGADSWGRAWGGGGAGARCPDPGEKWWGGPRAGCTASGPQGLGSPLPGTGIC